MAVWGLNVTMGFWAYLGTPILGVPLIRGIGIPAPVLAMLVLGLGSGAILATGLHAEDP